MTGFCGYLLSSTGFKDVATEEAALVRRCLRGEPEAIRVLVDRFQTEVFGLCVRLLSHRQDAEDVTQEVFLRIFRSLKRWDSNRPLKPWIIGITVNRCAAASPAGAGGLSAGHGRSPGHR